MLTYADLFWPVLTYAESGPSATSDAAEADGKVLELDLNLV